MVTDKMGDPQESSRERKRELAENVESILDSVDPALEEHAYPVDREELSARYGETVIELPNETESLGDVFDRLADDEYDSPMAVKEAVVRDVTEATPEMDVAGEDREPAPGSQGAPQEVIDDLEAVEGAETESPADEAPAVGTATDIDSAAEEPGDQFTPGTTEADEFAPQETIEDRDREDEAWADAEREPGDPAEPTAEPAEGELDEAERREAGEIPDDEVELEDDSKSTDGRQQ